MLRVIPFANALAAVTAIAYVLCGLLAALAPGLFLSLFLALGHGWDVLRLAADTQVITPGMFLAGLVEGIVITWLFGAGLALLCNAFSRTGVSHT